MGVALRPLRHNLLRRKLTHRAPTIFDVWDSADDLEAFGSTLMPIVAELGVDVGEPMNHAGHNVVTDPMPARVATSRTVSSSNALDP